jgi:hypothetical protein
MIPWFFVAFVLLLVALVWLVRRRAEAFVGTAAESPDPKQVLQKVRGILARYNDPALWEHLESVVGKDIGQLARGNVNKQ